MDLEPFRDSVISVDFQFAPKNRFYIVAADGKDAAIPAAPRETDLGPCRGRGLSMEPNLISITHRPFFLNPSVYIFSELVHFFSSAGSGRVAISRQR